MRSLRWTTLPLLVLLFAAVAPARAATTPEQKCAAAKRKFAGKKIAALTRCDAKAAEKGTTVDSSCVTTAQTAFMTRWGKAEAKGGCVTTGDATTIENKVDAHQMDLESSLTVTGVTPSKCTATKFKWAGKTGKCRLACMAKAARKGLPLADPTIMACLSACTTKFSAAFTAAESEGDCRTTGDAGTIESKIGAFVTDVTDALPAKNPCPTGQTFCAPTCVDTSTDPDNCGACDQLCPTGSGFVCTAGACGCPPGETLCGTLCHARPCYCVNTQSDENNCGGCGTVCFNPTGGPAACSRGCCLTDGSNGTIHDSCTGLQWEKKTGVVGSGANPGDLHDVNNAYSWAGCCNGSCATPYFCQVDTDAGSACATRSDGGTVGCSTTCPSGSCLLHPDAITTVWDWLNQLNATNFAGHNDWRLPSEGEHNFPASGSNELETILLASYPCGTSPCIDPIFGPTQAFYHWSSTSESSFPSDAWLVDFSDGAAVLISKQFANSVRAVRGP